MYLIWFITFCLVGLSTQEAVNVSVYYISSCPSSQRFIGSKLHQAYQKLGSEALNVKLYPTIVGYNTYGEEPYISYDIDCINGDEECFANKMQACALHLFGFNENTINFEGCVMSSRQPENKRVVRRCAKKSQIEWSSIKKCINTRGDEILTEIYDEFKELISEIDHFPHIIFNGVYDERTARKASINFLSTVCEMYKEKPAGCDIQKPTA
ncbi:unnamed protein product [Phyllotreta striolata]|uniref:Uncharacterized protein n=1 Tax=Phyllotreta striolata TaxID=444603 RepID=A0A9N9XK85_PHYSR|nr:unnamed protein product [Phyllotreta striolata]